MIVTIEGSHDSASRYAQTRQIAHWLRSKHVSLWQEWDLTDDEELFSAASWVYSLLCDIEAYSVPAA
jgi:hypothetical protein